MRINVDIDGVIRDFDGKLREVFRREYPARLLPPETRHWELAKTYPEPTINRLAFNTWAKEIYTFADPYPGAIENVRALIEAGHIVSFVTTQPNPTLKRLTLDWLDRFDLADTQDVLFVRSKSDYGCDIFVEDAPHNLQDLWDFQTAKVKLLRMARPWNKGAPGFAVTDMVEARHIIEKIVWNTKSK